MIDARAQAELHYRDVLRPGTGEFAGIGNIAISAGEERIAFDGTLYDAEEGPPRSAIAILHLDTDKLYRVGCPGASAMLPKWSPDGQVLAFLSDADGRPGIFQVWLAPAFALEAARRLTSLDGYCVESFEWSPTGLEILVQAAPLGADRAGVLGGTTIPLPPNKMDWEPAIKRSPSSGYARQAWIIDLEGRCEAVLPWTGYGVWEAVWCGESALAAILSENPSQGGWYKPLLSIISRESSNIGTVQRSSEQLAGLTPAPDGRYLALLEGQFHRLLGAGHVVLHDRETGETRKFELPNAEITSLRWRADGRLLFAGLKSIDTIVGHIDPVAGSMTIDECDPGQCGSRTPMVWPFGDTSTLRLVNDYHRRPCIEIREADGSGHRQIFQPTSLSGVQPGHVSKLSWQGRDGLEIDGFLVAPDLPGPHALVTFIHGGPVAASRPIWSLGAAVLPLLVKLGFAIFLPNPRGSLGRGSDFSKRVLGDVVGEDVHDILTGVDRLVEQGRADPNRLALVGGSYGGLLTTAIIGMDQRFKAAIAISPITHLRSQYYTAHHPEFLHKYVGADPEEIGGMFDLRSPIRRSSKVVTPLLLLAGALDNTTPASQAHEFFEALRMNGADVELVIYPKEGHGIAKQYEAQLDQGIRMAGWLLNHLGPN